MKRYIVGTKEECDKLVKEKGLKDAIIILEYDKFPKKRFARNEEIHVFKSVMSNFKFNTRMLQLQNTGTDIYYYESN